MKDWLSKNPMFFLLYIVFAIVAVVGGALVLFGEAGSLSFEEYLDNLTKFALAVGILGAGRAIKNGINPPAEDRVAGSGLPFAGSNSTAHKDSVPLEGEVVDERHEARDIHDAV